MCFFKRLKKYASPEKSAALHGETDKSAPANKSTNTFTEMRHQAGTVDPKLKGRHHTGSF